ncbi:MAG: hypothetical protein JXA13_09605 [Anaerolineales bacterium]|nr:hypothetical protein [Anaerolineales bacterium]
MNDLEEKSTEQFNAWSKDYEQKRFLPFYFSNRALLQVILSGNGSASLYGGCGTGILLGLLLRQNKDLTLSGMDITPHMVTTAQTKLGYSAKIKRVTAGSPPPKECTCTTNG